MKSAAHDQSQGEWTKVVVSITAAWVALAFAASIIAKVQWIAPKDFEYATAMKYHGLMVPLLVMSYLLSGRILRLRAVGGRTFTALAMLTVLLSGPASFANSSPGLSFVGILQISGMVLADVLGVLLLFALIRTARNHRGTEKKEDAVFWLFFSSVAGVLVASFFGHIAGWGIDIGIQAFPGMSALLKTTGMKPTGLQEGLVTSHSHLMVIAMITGLVALIARLLGYKRLGGWRRRAGLVTVWLVILSLASAAAIYATGVLTGWEPPALLVSGPNGENGIPLDDIALSLCELGWVMLTFISASVVAEEVQDPANGRLFRAAVLLNLTAGFLGVVALGLYIELNEVFFGGGQLPAPGALNDQAFIRSHIIYPLFILPILLCFILATASEAAPLQGARQWHRVFLWLSIPAIVLGLVGEYVWVVSLNRSMFLFAVVLLGAAMIAGAGALIRAAVLSPPAFNTRR